MSPGAFVRVLDHDPDLGAGLSDEELVVARQAVVAGVEQRTVGPWSPADRPGAALGALLLRGLVVRELVVAGSVSAELLGPGDLILPPPGPEVSFVPAETGWVVLEPIEVAWLATPFEQAARRWPALNRALLARVGATAARAAFLQNLAQLTRVEDRVLMVLWHLAERFGRVGPAGVVMPLRLTHRMIARLVGARRPSVTTAVLRLERAGAVERRVDGAFLLIAEPRAEVLAARPPDGPWEQRSARRPPAPPVALRP
jgi:DNA-binding MarR family transcriptional regulator